MVKVKADVSKNRLYITMLGTLTVNDALDAKQNIDKTVESLRQGFDVINDLSKFIRGDDLAGNVLKEIIVMLIQKGVNKVVRVVGTSKTGLMQFANNSLQLEQYQICYVPTIDAAEAFLNSIEADKNIEPSKTT